MRWGKSIPNEGQQELPLVTNDGLAAPMTYQVADVRKTLCSISKVCDRGNRVIFGRRGGVVQNMSSGVITPFRREGGIYILDMWLDCEHHNARNHSPPFPRQG